MEFDENLIYRAPIFSFEGRCEENLLLEAIYLSSPDLYYEIIKSKSNNTFLPKDLQKLNISNYKYESRSKSRATPFGLFAGVGISNWGKKQRWAMPESWENRMERKTRLDMNVLCNLAQYISNITPIKSHLRYFPNTSIYKIDNHLRYVEYYYSNSKRIHKISKVDFSKYIDEIVCTAKFGCRLSDLSTRLLAMDVPGEEIADFIDAIIEAQILVSELEANLTGIDYLDAILNILSGIKDFDNTGTTSLLLDKLITVKSHLLEIDRSILKTPEFISPYKEIQKEIQTLLPHTSEHNLFQTDLFFTSASNTVDEKIQNDIINCLIFLNRILPNDKNSALEDFKKRFSERFEDNEMPLLQTVDAECGVGYPAKDNSGVNPLIDKLVFNQEFRGEEIKWSPYVENLHRIITEALQQNSDTIHLDEKSFPTLNFTTSRLPFSMSVIFKLLDSNGTIHLRNAGGSSSINLLARFGQNHQKLQEIINKVACAENEQIGDRIFAEIVHLPESRTGNILARPEIREYEIPYLAKSTKPKEKIINASDLLVSVRNNRISLRDKRLNKEVIPRLGNAHNFSFNALPVYRFLCDLQNQYYEKSSLGFSWGPFSMKYTFLPRVKFKNIVIRPAQWILFKSDTEPLIGLRGNDLNTAFNKIKSIKKLPMYFLIVEGDNELFIDSNREIAVLTLLDAFKNKEHIIIEEFLFDISNSNIKDNQGFGFTNEFIGILYNKQHKLPVPLNPIRAKANIASSTKQTFVTGTEWLYLKIYCGIKTADTIIVELIYPIVRNLLLKNLVNKWFFIRYADPETHLRVRFHLPDKNNCAIVIRELSDALDKLVMESIISKLQYDTYQRELERYGPMTIEEIETIFFNDSECTIKCLELLDSSTGGELRWQFAARSADQLLADFGFNLEQKANIMLEMAELFFSEHGGSKQLKLQLDSNFRDNRKKLAQALCKGDKDFEDFDSLAKLINARSSSNLIPVKTISNYAMNYPTIYNLQDIVKSLIHMSCNRVFPSRNRTNELVIYDMLSRLYKSEIARNFAVKKAPKDR